MRCLLIAILLFASAAHSQDAADGPLDEVVVTGEYPGPGLWKVTRANDAGGHVLWIVGDPWALPRRLKWKSQTIEATAAAAQEILRDASVTMDSDERIGFFRGMALLPAILEARKNPDEATLEQVLPPELYARWLVEKKKYLGRERGVEKWRPLFAADRLRKEAFDDLKLRERGAVWEVVEDIARKRRIKVNTPTLTLRFKRSELREKLREFSRESLADVECFEKTLALTEALARRDVEEQRARAWATGNVEKLASLPALPSPYLPCMMAVMNAQVAREVIPADIAEQTYALWIDSAGTSLAANPVTFAVVPFGKLTRADGYLARLRDEGYVVEGPQ